MTKSFCFLILDVDANCTKDISWDEDKLASLSIINILASEKCLNFLKLCLFSLFGISFTIMCS